MASAQVIASAMLLRLNVGWLFASRRVVRSHHVVPWSAILTVLRSGRVRLAMRRSVWVLQSV